MYFSLFAQARTYLHVMPVLAPGNFEMVFLGVRRAAERCGVDEAQKPGSEAATEDPRGSAREAVLELGVVPIRRCVPPTRLRGSEDVNLPRDR